MATKNRNLDFATRAIRIAQEQAEIRQAQAVLAARIDAHGKALDEHCARVRVLAESLGLVPGAGESPADPLNLGDDSSQFGIAIGKLPGLPVEEQG